ncbi:MAG TPA: hypothetical protein VF053_13330 [Streptosporangiales bacterium]
MSARTAPAAVATASVFAGGALLTQTVVVPHWRALDPAAFHARFAVEGPASGATVFPFELAAVVLLAVTTWSAVRNREPRRLLWALATGCMLGTLLVLAYFVPADLALLGHGIPPDALPAQLAVWYRWNWVRTGLGLASAALACAAATTARRRSRRRR